MSNLEVGVQVGDFRIIRRIGAGGMGIVYEALQVSLNRVVALKVLGSALNHPSDIARFRREAQAIAKLHHQGIASIYYVGQDEQVCFLAMEFVEGSSLREVVNGLVSMRAPAETLDSILRGLDRGDSRAQTVRFDEPTATYRPRSEDIADENEPGTPTPQAMQLLETPAYISWCCEIVRDAALALAHAHEHGVVHRDIKPENIMLDRQGRPRIIDFGIARFLEDMTLTNTGALIGTPMYMSPEQVSGRLKVDHRTDVYSLGLVLYELLRLGRPIIGATREGVLRNVLTKALSPVSWDNRAVSRELEAVVHRATSKDPEERYQAIGQFAEDLDNVLRGRAVNAPPYRYRFDEREIAAERPTTAVFVGFSFFVLAVMIATPALAFGLVMVIGMLAASAGSIAGSGGVPWSILAWAALGIIASVLVCSLGIGTYILAKRLLEGRELARRLAGIYCIFLVIACCSGGIFLIVRLVKYGGDVENGIPGFLFIVAAVVAFSIWVLLREMRMRSWFDYAEQLRSEHGEFVARRRK